MLDGMSDPQLPPIPPYASGAGRSAQPGQSQQTPPHYRGQHPAPQGYVLNGQSSSAGQPPYAQTGTATGNPAGRIGLIVGLIGLGVGILMNVLVQVTIRGGDYASISLISSASVLITFIAAVVALILGSIGLKRVGAPHAQAGIAVGLGIAGVVSGVYAFLLTASSWLFYM